VNKFFLLVCGEEKKKKGEGEKAANFLPLCAGRGELSTTPTKGDRSLLQPRREERKGEEGDELEFFFSCRTESPKEEHSGASLGEGQPFALPSYSGEGGKGGGSVVQVSSFFAFFGQGKEVLCFS